MQVYIHGGRGGPAVVFKGQKQVVRIGDDVSGLLRGVLGVNAPTVIERRHAVAFAYAAQRILLNRFIIAPGHQFPGNHQLAGRGV